MEKSIAMVDLDLLLDTRVGTLFKINPEEAKLILERGFRERISDTLDGYSDVIGTDEYIAAYEDRDVSTLVLSRPTRLLTEFVTEYRRLIFILSDNFTTLNDCCLIVNIHPYDLTDAELVAIKESIEYYLGDEIPVRIAKFDINSTQLSYLDMRGITDYMTYDVEAWMFMQFGNATKMEDFVSFPDITVWGSKFLTDKNSLKNLHLKEPGISEKDSPWDLATVTFAPFVKLQWLEPESVSLI